MSTIAASASNRPTTVTAAAALTALFAGLGVIGGFIGQHYHGTSFLIIALTFVALRLVALSGVWACRRWGAILGFVVTFLELLLSVPGIFDGSGTAMTVMSIVAVSLAIPILILLAWPSSRKAYV